jgi:7-carboxy-7-deazaguanine synthase
MTLNVSELFYAPQGEGARAGEPSLFVRLQGCSAKHACYASGVRCDTEFESGAPMALDDLFARLAALSPSCKWIVWTGGEPLDQLTMPHLHAAHDRGYYNALETSGAHAVDPGLAVLVDWLVCSPKVAEHVLAKQFAHVARTWRGHPAACPVEVARHGTHVDELRYPRHIGQGLPAPALRASVRYVSPLATGATLDDANVAHCLALVASDPSWRVSLQLHKVWRSL